MNSSDASNFPPEPPFDPSDTSTWPPTDSSATSVFPPEPPYDSSHGSIEPPYGSSDPSIPAESSGSAESESSFSSGSSSSLSGCGVGFIHNPDVCDFKDGHCFVYDAAENLSLKDCCINQIQWGTPPPTMAHVEGVGQVWAGSEPEWAKVTAQCNPGDTLTLAIAKAEIKEVLFESDHKLLMDYDADFKGESNNPYDPRGWVKDSEKNNPVSLTQGTNVVLKVKVKVKPEGINCVLKSNSPIAGLDFESAPFVSQGDFEIALTLTSKTKLESKVQYIQAQEIQWTVEARLGRGASLNAGISGPHEMFITWATPIVEMPIPDSVNPTGGPRETRPNKLTYKRLKWACDAASGSDTERKVVDAIWNKVPANFQVPTENDPTLGSHSGWQLMDEPNKGGDCDNHAITMAMACRVLGSAATLKFIFASSNANCLEFESIPGPTASTAEVLMMFFNGVANWYEGVCFAAGRYYAVTPHLDADTDCKMLNKIFDYYTEEGSGRMFSQRWMIIPTPFTVGGAWGGGSETQGRFQAPPNCP